MAVSAPAPRRVVAVVATMGVSPLLEPCLRALRREGGGALRLVVVDQGAEPAVLPPGVADEVRRPGRNLGFAAGTNRGLEGAGEEWVAAVNDDVVVERGWLALLIAALEEDPAAAAAQGVNLEAAAPARVDGRGLAWNRAWQAVQLGRGETAPDPRGAPREIFGVSATAALYRASALAAVTLPGGRVFDDSLGSYYEDVELACRLRAAGYRALLVPAARARHAGSTTGSALGAERWRLLYGNRHLVLARLLGTAYWLRLPALLLRDLKDLAAALARGEGDLAAGIAGGWGRALRRLPHHARRGAPALPLARLGRFRRGA